jgi:hypothetical protein
MLSDYIYYGGIGLIGMAGSFGILSIINPDLGKRIFWNTIKGYHYIKFNYNKVKKGYDNINMTSLKEQELPKMTYMGYKIKDGTTFKCKKLKEWYEYNDKFDLEIVIHKDDDDTEYYKIINEKNTIENDKFEKCEPIFIQVEIEQNGERTSIHENLKPFYLNFNMILDKKFLKWYLEKFYAMVLNEKYKLHIIDNNINLFQIDENQSIHLFKENGLSKYNIIN